MSPNASPPPKPPPLPAPATGTARRPDRSRWVLWGVLAVLAVLVAVLYSQLAGQSGASPLFTIIGLVLAIFFVLLVAWLALLFHAFGHVLGGIIGGLEFRLLYVWPLAIFYQGGTRVARLKARTPNLGYMVVSLPRDTRNLRRRLLIFYLTGPLVSFALAALLFLGPLPPISNLLLIVFTATSFAWGVLELLPLTIGGYDTDGKRVLRLLKRDSRAGEEALFRLVAISLDEPRPGNIDPKLAETALATERPPAVTAALLRLAYGMALDRGVLTTARDYLAQGLALWDRLPAPWQRVMALEAVYFETARRGDLPAAQAWLAAAGEPIGIRSSLELRAEAAVALAEGDEERASDLIIGAIRKLGGTMTPGFAAAEEVWLREMGR